MTFPIHRQRLVTLLALAFLVAAALLGGAVWMLPMLGVIRRLWGMKDEISPQSYDNLAAGLVTDADTFWPVTGGTADKNSERIERAD